MIVKPVLNNEQLREYAKITSLAYPEIDMNLDELSAEFIEVNREDPSSIFYVCYDEEKIVGGMRVIDYEMNYNGEFIKISGIGMISVDLIAKKKGVTTHLLRNYLRQSDKDGQYIAMLYPFRRPEFYYKMGFGYGPKYYNYNFAPDSLNKLNDYDSIIDIHGADMPLVAECYLRYAKKQHGFCKRGCYELNSFKKRFLKEGTIVGYRNGEHLDGYIYFVTKKIDLGGSFKYKLVIKEWVYNTPEAFLGLSGFLNIQKDQYDIIEYETQKEDFHFAFSDIRRAKLQTSANISNRISIEGVGLMYRIVNVEKFIEKVLSTQTFNCPDLEISLAMTDSIMPINQGVFNISIKKGKISLLSELTNAMQVKMSISEFSSLMIGSAKFKNLYRIGKIKCNEKDVDDLECFFNFQEKPECITRF